MDFKKEEIKGIVMELITVTGYVFLVLGVSAIIMR